jgi:hypothetical protein
VLPSLLCEYHPKDIFNGNDCVTVLVWTDVDGLEKKPIAVSGKSGKPRCLKHTKSLPCVYRHNSSVWKGEWQPRTRKYCCF